MADSAGVAQKLWDEWLPRGTREIVSNSVGGDADLSRRVYCFLAGSHDIGKATPIFQVQTWGFGPGEDTGLAWKPEKAGLPLRYELCGRHRPSHPIAGETILNAYLAERFGWNECIANSYSCIVGGHHGKPPTEGELIHAKTADTISLGWDAQFGEAWRKVQRELIDYVASLTGFDESTVKALSQHRLSPVAESILTGLVIMADWIASNADFFPLIALFPDAGSDRIVDDGYVGSERLRQRGEYGWHRAGIAPHWQGMLNAEESVDDLYAERFVFPKGAKPRPVQEGAANIARTVEDPGLMVIEAPMGTGKTEAALAAAEILAGRSGRGGVCLALPTMATTDAMFGRVHDWLRHLPQQSGANEKSIYLAHGKAQLNDEFQGFIRESEKSEYRGIGIDVQTGKVSEDIVVADWLRGRKKGVLANFLVCTVDQVLMGALNMKHLALRQLALANKVVIIDECHAYDIYMQQYLFRVLEWLGASQTPVILLSATLPEEQRRKMVDAYIQGKTAIRGVRRSPETDKPHRARWQRGRHQESTNAQNTVVTNEVTHQSVSQAYPLITYTTGLTSVSQPVASSGDTSAVSLNLIADDDASLLNFLDDRLSDGGCAGVICDTVSRAQDTAAMLAQHFGDGVVTLTHSRFVDIDRMLNEADLRSRFGPKATTENGERPRLAIVVGTQVLEQSLDIDFDVMVTDIAPVDLIMQRLGRVHRHRRGKEEQNRSEKLRHAVCCIRGIYTWQNGLPKFAKGIDSVYFAATLMEALAALGLIGERDSAGLSLPEDIAALVRCAYSDAINAKIPRIWQEDWQQACVDRASENDRKKSRSKTCMLRSVNEMCCQEQTLVDWFEQSVDTTGSDDDKGQRAVRDTQETVEVLLLRKDGDDVRLLPWIGSEDAGVEKGAIIPTTSLPPSNVAKVAAQCAVRLPLSMCSVYDLDPLIGELEKGCGEKTMYWQDSPWLAGSLAVFMAENVDGKYSAKIHGYDVWYEKRVGLITKK
jgi:CRISPR-associated endonuclease/helicase Cas3